MSRPVVAIVGRPNVGKSSLFNRLIQRRHAVVDKVAGVTRDRNYSICDWSGREFLLVDTGGIIPEAKSQMERAITEQAEFAIAEADLVMFMVDCQVGVDTIDLKISRNLKRAGKACLLVANKADNETLGLAVHDFYSLGLGEPSGVSALTGRGIGELLDDVLEALPEPSEDEEEETDVIRVAVVGRPNVGKSSYINSLVGKERHLVSEVAGTTRDAVDTAIELEGQKYIMVDTAGIRKKFKIHENIEFFTYLRTVRAIEKADVAVVLIDAVDGLTSQDQHVLAQVLEARRAAVLGINKWDLIEKDSKTADKYALEVRDKLAKYSHLPLMFLSATSGQRVPKLMTYVKEVYENHHKKISTSELNEFLQEVTAKRKPPARRGKYIQLKYMTQTEVAPPTFVIFANHPQLLEKSYVSYISNQLRDRYSFDGVPIRVKFRK